MYQRVKMNLFHAIRVQWSRTLAPTLLDQRTAPSQYLGEDAPTSSSSKFGVTAIFGRTEFSSAKRGLFMNADSVMIVNIAKIQTKDLRLVIVEGVQILLNW